MKTHSSSYLPPYPIIVGLSLWDKVRQLVTVGRKLCQTILASDTPMEAQVRSRSRHDTSLIKMEQGNMVHFSYFFCATTEPVIYLVTKFPNKMTK